MMRKDETIFMAGGAGMVGLAIIRKLLASGSSNIVTNYHKRMSIQL
jgi:nucleoside-diphosphate-sugar epimerase